MVRSYMVGRRTMDGYDGWMNGRIDMYIQIYVGWVDRWMDEVNALAYMSV